MGLFIQESFSKLQHVYNTLDYLIFLFEFLINVLKKYYLIYVYGSF
jgi:hypothetical protein